MSLSDLSFHAAEAFVRATEQARTPRAKETTAGAPPARKSTAFTIALSREAGGSERRWQTSLAGD